MVICPRSEEESAPLALPSPSTLAALQHSQSVTQWVICLPLCCYVFEQSRGGEPTLRRRRRDRGFHHKRALAVNSRCLAREAREKTPREDHTQTQAASDAASGRQGAARRG